MIVNDLVLKFDSNQSRVIPYLLYITCAGVKFERTAVRADDDLLAYGSDTLHLGITNPDYWADKPDESF